LVNDADLKNVTVKFEPSLLMINNANSKDTIYLIVKRESVNKTKTRSLKEIRFIT